MLLPSEGRGIDFLKNLTAFQDLVSKTQVMKCRLFSGNATALGGQGGVHGVPDMLLSPPPFARPSLEKKRDNKIYWRCRTMVV